MSKNVKKLLSKSMSGRRLLVVFASLIVAFSVIGFVTFKATQASVALTLDGKKQKIKTHAKTVKELLADQDIKWKKGDYISKPLDADVTDNMKIVWKSSKPVKLVVGSQKKTIWTTANTVQDVLNERQIQLSKHDQIHPSQHTTVKKDLNIEVSKAFPVTLQQSAHQKKVWSTSTTVADFLEQQGIKLNRLDRVEPNLSSPISPNSKVNIIRVEKVTDVVEAPVDYAVVTKSDPSLKKGKKKVIEEGEQGRVRKHYRVILENGKEVSRTLVKQEEKKSSKDRVVAVGSKVEKPVSKTAAEVSYNGQVSRSNNDTGKEMRVMATAYTAFCTGCSGKTRTGVDLRANPNAKVIAVDPDVIPLGSKVYVEGYGYAIAADTGSAINGNRIDVFFSDQSEAYRWGRRTIKIKVLN
ncbi:G5 and 3D domain-containing protein [Priestia koreensis]|uniref:G5 and 3D domain-containing protein n=1 Tax=Priestia koreensis TaxID=284581 RepID=UPI001F57FEB4|nr:G5 and 3D domain-containing protein [Priestia koreensis]UNL85066.1 DUF348 domain-containing protein [Priestia koreensis]